MAAGSVVNSPHIVEGGWLPHHISRSQLESLTFLAESAIYCTLWKKFQSDWTTVQHISSRARGGGKKSAQWLDCLHIIHCEFHMSEYVLSSVQRRMSLGTSLPSDGHGVLIGTGWWHFNHFLWVGGDWESWKPLLSGGFFSSGPMCDLIFHRYLVTTLI